MLLKFQILFGILFLALVSVQCNTKKEIPQTFEGPHIAFGQGGGFSGLKTEYILLRNGNLYKRNAGSKDFKALKPFDKQFVGQIHRNIDFLNLKEIRCNNPGDLYYYVELHEKESVHRMVWGKPDFKPDQTLVSFYNILFRSVKTRSNG